MTIREESEKFLEDICKVDIRLSLVPRDSSLKEVILKDVSEQLEAIRNMTPDIVEDIKRRIINYQGLRDPEVKVSDFVGILIYFKLSISDTKDKSYWSQKGEHYNLRMNEVINMFLMSKQISM